MAIKIIVLLLIVILIIMGASILKHFFDRN